VTVLRRWAPWAVLAIVAAVSLAIGVQRPGHPTLQQRTLQLAGEVRCPVCTGESAAQSQAPEAAQVRQQIETSLAAGQAPSAILNRLVSEFGASILEKPQPSGVSLLVWVLPIAVAGVAAVGLGVALVRWRRRRTPMDLDEVDRSRVAEALQEHQ
jgi:cytochrome c-type biogenesis protein CcmH